MYASECLLFSKTEAFEYQLPEIHFAVLSLTWGNVLQQSDGQQDKGKHIC